MIELGRYALRRLSSGFTYRLRARFTPAGWLALGCLAFAAVEGVDTRQSVAYQAFTFLLSALALAVLSGLVFKPALEARRRLPRFGTVGQALPFSVRLRNRGRRALRGLILREELADPRPGRAEFREERDPAGASWYARLAGYARWERALARKRSALVDERPVPDLSPGSELDVELRLSPLRRGRLILSGLAALRPDPLGLFLARAPLRDEQSILILPKRYPVPRLQLPGRRLHQPGGVALSSSVGDSQEFRALRDYRPGDPLRQIHWRSWAKTGQLIVKEQHDEYFVRHALVLDSFGPPGEAFEEAVSVAASLSCSALTQESLLDLLFIGDRSYCFTAGRGLGGPERLLELLAGVQPCRRSFSELRASVLGRAGTLSGCVLVLLGWDEERRALLEALRSAGLPTLCLSIGAPRESLPAGVLALELGSVAEGLARL